MKISEVIFSEYSERFVLLLVRFSFLEYVLVGAVTWKHLPKNLKILFVLIMIKISNWGVDKKKIQPW